MAEANMNITEMKVLQGQNNWSGEKTITQIEIVAEKFENESNYQSTYSGR